MTYKPNKQIGRHQKNTLPVCSWKKTLLFLTVVFGSSLLTTACSSAKSDQSATTSANSQPQASAVNQSAKNGNSTTIKIGYLTYSPA